MALHGEEQAVGVEATGRVPLDDRGAHDHLAEELAPRRLGPARLGDGPVEVVVAERLGKAGRDLVRDRIALRVEDHLRLAGRSRREVEQHRVVGLRPLDLGAVEVRVDLVHELLVAHPVEDAAVDDHLVLQRRALPRDLIDAADVCDVGDDHAGLGPVHAVGDVLRGEEHGAGHGDDAELDHADHRDVPLGNALEHDEDAVALLETELPEHVREAVGEAAEVEEGVVVGLLRVALDGDEGELRAVLGPAIHHVESEVEVLRYVQLERVVKGLVIGLFGRSGGHGLRLAAGTHPAFPGGECYRPRGGTKRNRGCAKRRNGGSNRASQPNLRSTGRAPEAPRRDAARIGWSSAGPDANLGACRRATPTA